MYVLLINVAVNYLAGGLKLRPSALCYQRPSVVPSLQCEGSSLLQPANQIHEQLLTFLNYFF